MSERVLTLKLTVKDPDAAAAIWESHGKNALLVGCKIGSICEGDIITEHRNYESYVEYLEEKRLFEDGKIMDFDEWKAET